MGGERYECVVLGGLYFGLVDQYTAVDQCGPCGPVWHIIVDQCGPVWNSVDHCGPPPLESNEMLHVHCLPCHPHQELNCNCHHQKCCHCCHDPN